MFPSDGFSLRGSKVYNLIGCNVHADSSVCMYFMSNYTVCDNHNCF